MGGGPAGIILLLALTGLALAYSNGGADVSRCLVCFQSGVLIAIHKKHLLSESRAGALASLAIASVAIAKIIGLTGMANILVMTSGACCLLIAVLSANPLVQFRMLDHAVARFTGQISYSIYLMHVPVIYVLVQAFHAFGIASCPIFVVAPLLILATLVSTLAASYLSYWWIEFPSIRIGLYCSRLKGLRSM